MTVNDPAYRLRLRDEFALAIVTGMFGHPDMKPGRVEQRPATFARDVFALADALTEESKAARR